jgi:hypothetical protein
MFRRKVRSTYHQNYRLIQAQKGFTGSTIMGAVLVGLVLVGLAIGVVIVQQQQNTRTRAATECLVRIQEEYRLSGDQASRDPWTDNKTVAPGVQVKSAVISTGSILSGVTLTMEGPGGTKQIPYNSLFSPGSEGAYTIIANGNGCNNVRASLTVSASCANSCSICIANTMGSGFKAQFVKDGFVPDASCANYDRVVNQWCNSINPTDCRNIKAQQCASACTGGGSTGGTGTTAGSGNYTVAGKVKDASGRGVSGVGIAVHDSTQNKVLNTTTGADGAYSVKINQGDGYAIRIADTKYHALGGDHTSMEVCSIFRDVSPDSSSPGYPNYECQKAGTNDCAGPGNNGQTGRCDFVLKTAAPPIGAVVPGRAGPSSGTVSPLSFPRGSQVQFNATSTNADSIIVQILRENAQGGPTDARELGTIQGSQFGQNVSFTIPADYPVGPALIRFYARKAGLEQEQPANQTSVTVTEGGVGGGGQVAKKVVGYQMVDAALGWTVTDKIVSRQFNGQSADQTTYTFSDDKPTDFTPRLKTILVRYEYEDGTFGTEEKQSLYYQPLDKDMTVSNIACSLDPANPTTSTKITITGQDFGSSKGTLTYGGQSISTVNWGDSSISATYASQLQDSQPIVITKPSGKTITGYCTLETTQIQLTAQTYCRIVRRPVTKAKVELKKMGSNEVVYTSSDVVFDESGTAKDIKLPKNLDPNAKYRVVISIPGALKRVIPITPKSKETTIINETVKVFLGDIAPGGGDGIINSFDIQELVKNQWSPAKDVAGKTGDFNIDARVNSIDYACLGSNINKAADVDEGASNSSGTGVSNANAASGLNQSSNTDVLSCTTDTDCSCGKLSSNNQCSVANKTNITANSAGACTDFCTGFTGNLTTKCVSNKCTQVTKAQ